MVTPAYFNDLGAGYLPGYLGIVVTDVSHGRACVEFVVKPALIAPNGYLHAGSVVALADTAAGYGCIASLPAGATGFTTIELKSNHFGTARDGDGAVCRHCRAPGWDDSGVGCGRETSGFREGHGAVSLHAVASVRAEKFLDPTRTQRRR